MSQPDRSAVAPQVTWRRRLWLWGPPAIYALAIFFTSSLSSPPSPPQLTDKHMHLSAYAGLALVILRALSGGRWAGVTVVTGLQAVAMATAYGVTDEWHQSFVPGRYPDLLDVVADATGGALAVAVPVALAWWTRRRRHADGTIERAAGKVGPTP